MGELRAMDTDLYSAFTSLLPDDFDFFLSVVKSHITGSFRYRNSVTFSSCAMTGCNCLQQFLLMNILVQAEKYANEFATGCNSFIAAFILFYFICAADLKAIKIAAHIKINAAINAAIKLLQPVAGSFAYFSACNYSACCSCYSTQIIIRIVRHFHTHETSLKFLWRQKISISHTHLLPLQGILLHMCGHLQ